MFGTGLVKILRGCLRPAVQVRWWNDPAQHLKNRRPIIEKKIVEIFGDAPKVEEQIQFSAKLRSLTGHHVAKLRKSGLIPAAIIGKGLPEILIEVEKKAVAAVLRKSDMTSKIVSLNVDGFEGSFVVESRQVQLHPVTDQPLSLTFVRTDEPEPKLLKEFAAREGATQQ